MVQHYQPIRSLTEEEKELEAMRQRVREENPSFSVDDVELIVQLWLSQYVGEKEQDELVDSCENNDELVEDVMKTVRDAARMFR